MLNDRCRGRFSKEHGTSVSNFFDRTLIFSLLKTINTYESLVSAIAAEHVGLHPACPPKKDGK